jgi:hypothetical protein
MMPGRTPKDEITTHRDKKLAGKVDNSAQPPNGNCDVEISRLDAIEMLLIAIMGEINEINTTLVEMARNQPPANPQKFLKRKKKKVLEFSGGS